MSIKWNPSFLIDIGRHCLGLGRLDWKIMTSFSRFHRGRDALLTNPVTWINRSIQTSMRLCCLFCSISKWSNIKAFYMRFCPYTYFQISQRLCTETSVQNWRIRLSEMPSSKSSSWNLEYHYFFPMERSTQGGLICLTGRLLELCDIVHLIVTISSFCLWLLSAFLFILLLSGFSDSSCIPGCLCLPVCLICT